MLLFNTFSSQNLQSKNFTRARRAISILFEVWGMDLELGEILTMNATSPPKFSKIYCHESLYVSYDTHLIFCVIKKKLKLVL